MAAVMFAGGLVLAPAASASTIISPAPVALFGLPSLHSIVEAIANDFFGALAGALVPSWLKHGSVATIQHLVALPDPASWSHVSQLQGEMTYLGAMLLPVTLAVGATRYWLVGLTGGAHPASALVRCAGSTGVLVAYHWIVEQTVAAVNTLTHGILGLPVVSAGLGRIIGVLFGGALLSGGGGVFGAFLVIVGVVFAAGLFAAQVLLTVALAVVIVAGPPLIALAAIPELSHLARGWTDALIAIALVPLGWTVLFATAGALCLDATSFTGASGGLPGHIAAAFAGLITFVLAVRLPMMAVGEIRSIFSRRTLRTAASSSQGTPHPLPGSERVRAAQARLRSVGLQAVPSLGASVGRAAGALGAPAGGPIGAARRRITAAAQQAGLVRDAGRSAAGTRGKQEGRKEGRTAGVRERLTRARAVLARAPAEAITAMNAGRHRAHNVQGSPHTRAAAARANQAGRAAGRPGSPGSRAPQSPSAERPPTASARGTADRRAAASIRRASGGERRPPAPGRGRPGDVGRPPSASGKQRATGRPTPPRPPEMHPAGKPTVTTHQQGAPGAQRSPRNARTPAPTQPSRGTRRRKTPAAGPPAARAGGTRPRAAKRKPRPRSQP